MRRTVCRRLSAESGFWKTICSARTSADVRCASAGASSRPSSATEPAVGSTMPSSVRANVVLPQPDSPTSPSVSPGQITVETPPSACTLEPCCMKILVRSSTRISGSPAR